MTYSQALTNTSKLHGATIAIDFGNSHIKAAVYDEGVKTPQAVKFNERIPDFIPSALYIPTENSQEILFGCDAMCQAETDSGGVLLNLNNIIDKFTVEIKVGNRPPRNKQLAINALFFHIKEQSEQLSLNGRKLANCVIITEETIPPHRQKTILKAAKSAGFTKVSTMNRLKAITNYWLYANDQPKYATTRHLLIADIQTDFTNIGLQLNNGIGFDEVALKEFDKFEVGSKTLSQIAWNNLISDGTIENPTEELSDIEKVKVIREALKDSIFNARPINFNGTILDIPSNVLEKTQKDFCLQFKSHLEASISHIEELHSGSSIELMVVGTIANTEGIKSLANELCPESTFIPDHPESTSTLGGSIPNSPQWLKKQNLMNKLELASGVQFGVYSILRSLGKGGMGEVWLAHHETMDIPVAIKVVHSHLTKSSDSIDRFMAEIRNTAKLRHPNIVRAHDAGCLHGINYLVSDYVNGVSLSQQLGDRKFLAEDEVLKIGRFIGEALKYAWDKHRILHRDIKPDNIMVDNEGEIMLMDMGISKSLLEKPIVLTADDTLLGSPHYMSPEQIRGTESDFRSDIYSLGATLFHLATGSQPYEGESIINVATRHLTDEIPDASERNTALSSDFVALLKKMMAKKPENREQSWQAVIDEIDFALYGELSEDGDDGEEDVESDETGRKMPSKVLLLIFLSLAFIYAGVSIINNIESDKIPITDLTDPAARKTVTFTLKPSDSKVTIFKGGKLHNNLKEVPAEKAEFKFSPGVYVALISRDGFKSLTKQFIVTKSNKVLPFSLEAYLGSVAVETIPGSKLTVTDKDGATSEAGVTDRNGVLPLSMQIGAYKLLIEREDHVSVTIDLSILRGTNPKIKIPLKLKGGIVRLESENSYKIYRNQEIIGNTNENIKTLKPGTYEVQISRKGFISRKRELVVTERPSFPIKIDELTEMNGDIVVNITSSIANLDKKHIPTTAEIKINGGEWKSKELPLIIEHAQCKEYKLELKIENFVITPDFTTVTVEHEKKSHCNFVITPVKSSILITNDETVPLYIDDKEIGQTNIPFDKISLLQYSITAKKEGYKDVILEISPEPQQVTEVKLPKMIKIHGDLLVQMELNPNVNSHFIAPKQVEISINRGKWKKVTLPLTIPRLPSKEYKVSLRSDGCVFKPTSLSIDVKDQIVNKAKFIISPDTIHITVNSNVRLAEVKNREGHILGKTGQMLAIMPFSVQHLTVFKDGYRSHDLKLTINKIGKGEKEVEVILERSNGPIISKEWDLKLIDMKMKPIVKGSFIMGSKTGKSDERITHKVNFTNPFWISATPVTQKQFETILGFNPSLIKHPNHPVTKVSWLDAINFCKKLTELEKANGNLHNKDFYTLPTEAEWEYCCKATSITPFHYGTELTSNDANFDGRYSYTATKRGILRGTTTDVASFKPNRWGLYDMHGNIWEWCLDTYAHAYKSIEQTNPMGPNVMAGDKVLRGGSWKNYPKDCRSTARYNRPRTARDLTIGFRIILKIND